MAISTPLQLNQFTVEAGFSRIGFSRVQLPRIERDVVRYREGSSKLESLHLIPGLLRFGECTLEHGVTPANNEFFQWMQTVHIGVAERRDVVVRLLDGESKPVAAWLLRNCFPVALEWSVLDGQSSAVLIESLRLAVEEVRVEFN